MPKQIIIAEQHRVAAVFSEEQIEELVVAQGSHQIGDIYLGLVENVLPGIDAAFVNIGDRERNGFIHVGDLGPLRLHRNSRSITELLHPQQKVLVQVMKEPTGSKGPRLTGNVSLPGRYLVLMPYRKGVNLSRRISSEHERSRLRALAVLIKPAGMGLLIRTEAEGVAEEAIIEDLECLQKQWASIQEEAQTTRPPALLNRDNDFIQRVLRDVFSTGVNRIVVDSAHGLKRVKQHLMSWSSGRIPPGVFIDQHRERTSILEFFRIEAAIREALKPRVDLPSGGYVIIEPTEALTVIDVNSGSFTQSATARETVLWTNCEAATEIARQLRLRNLAGVIVVDFIDMESRRDQLQVLKHFEEALKQDKARPQIAQLTELGLVELTRKRQGQNIYELFGQVCSYCGGQGYHFHIPGGSSSNLIGTASPSVMPSVGYIPDTVASPSPVPQQPAPLVPVPWSNEDWDENGESDRSDFSGDLSRDPSSTYSNGSPSRSSAPNRRRRRRPGEPATIDLSDNDDLVSTVTQPPAPSSGRYASSEETSESGGRYGSRRSRSPVRPAEVVPVEMTPAQQEVYAWMGVSPLLLSPEYLDSDQNIVVNVVEPGTLPRHSPMADETEADDDANPLMEAFDMEDEEDTDDDEFALSDRDETDQDAFDFPLPIVKTLGVSSAPSTREVDSFPERQRAGEMPKLEQMSPTAVDPPAESSPSDESPAPNLLDSSTAEDLELLENRRRRRRSSAARTALEEE